MIKGYLTIKRTVIGKNYWHDNMLMLMFMICFQGRKYTIKRHTHGKLKDFGTKY